MLKGNRYLTSENDILRLMSSVRILILGRYNHSVISRNRREASGSGWFKTTRIHSLSTKRRWTGMNSSINADRRSRWHSNPRFFSTEV